MKYILIIFLVFISVIVTVSADDPTVVAGFVLGPGISYMNGNNTGYGFDIHCQLIMFSGSIEYYKWNKQEIVRTYMGLGLVQLLQFQFGFGYGDTPFRIRSNINIVDLFRKRENNAHRFLYPSAGEQWGGFPRLFPILSLMIDFGKTRRYGASLGILF
ncbi:MAG: hypothetical protein ABH873_02340 [Candidatus Firestonebacteria bacterium]